MTSGAKQDHFLVRSLDFDAVGFDIGIILERLVDDAAVVGVHWLQFEDVTPPTDLFGTFACALDELLAGLPPVPADVEDDPRGGFVAAMDDAVQEVLQVAQGCSLAAYEAARVVGLHVEHELAFDVEFLDLSIVEAQVSEHLDEGFLGCERAHDFGKGGDGWVQRRTGLSGEVGVGVASAGFEEVSFVWRMLSRFCTVQ